ncbi:MAG: Stk1 family PASTA domain-containing Ser/Thr kinase [Acidimicrobiales bacterium]
MSRTSDQVGRVLGGRYRLIAPIGTGASAHVYLANDAVLGRQVAVKILHPGLVSEPSFLRRFQAEAQAAAGLNHSHIMRVFDWGQDQDEPFLVLEYLGGGSLRGMLDAGNRLDVAQAAMSGWEAARALDYAHRRGLVHRDIKPANLLFEEEGRLCVADFGLARALAEATWTEPEGAMLGTARYASPEQAQGRDVDGRSDVYSLALVLIEAVTGSVPFAADTTIATLMARADRPLPVPPQMAGLVDVLSRAGTSSPDERLDAAGMAEGLARVARLMGRPQPLSLAGPRSMAGQPYPLGTAPGQAVGAGSSSDTLVGAGSSSDTLVGADHTTVVGVVAPQPELTSATGVFDQESQAGNAAGIPARRWGRGGRRGGEGGPHGPPPSRSKRRGWRLALVLVLVAAIVAAVLGARYGLGVGAPSEVVPNLVTQTEAAATQVLARDHLKLRVIGSRFDSDIGAGEVVTQSVGPGGRLKQGSYVDVVLSKGPAPRAVPSLVGDTQDQANKALAGAGFKDSFKLVYDETILAGIVVSWAPRDGLQPKGATVAVLISQGPAPRKIPAFAAGSSYADASAALSNLGLIPSQAQVYSSSVPPGQVVTTNPGPGTMVKRGSAVTVEISKGPAPVPVPDVSGDTVAQATDVLTKAGFVVGTIYGPQHGQHVIFTDPSSGTPELPGTAVNLYVI